MLKIIVSINHESVFNFTFWNPFSYLIFLEPRCFCPYIRHICVEDVAEQRRLAKEKRRQEKDNRHKERTERRKNRIALRLKEVNQVGIARGLN